MSPHRKSHAPRSAERAFTIVELLTVIFIVAVLIAILLPALSAVQGSGRKASTQSLLVELTSAAASFELDARRQPGYFSMDELGSIDNWDTSGWTGAGLTALENAMLDLSGIGAISTVEPADPDNWVVVNPTGDSARRVWVKADLIGVEEGNYFLPGRSVLAHMSAPRQQPGEITEDHPANSGLPDGLPDLIDSFGQPIVAWIENENAPRNIRSSADFAAVGSDGDPAMFYWASNGSMLSSESLGEMGRSMRSRPTQSSDGSLIGRGLVEENPGEVHRVMSALLGHPGYPDEATLAAGDYNAIFPKRPRAGFVAHSAGEDGVFLSSADRRFGRLMGGEMFGGGSFNISYGVNFFSNVQGDRRFGENRQPETADFLDAFDDQVAAQ